MTSSVSSLSCFSQAESNAAIVAFVLYIVGVMGLAILSNRLRSSKSFLGEYFLGSRSLGVWAFALTFAATSASGGSFVGFPSLVYTHGWVVALWIGSYMIVPLVSMGLLAKRVNQVSRKIGAITIPDLLRDRFSSPGLGLLSTGLIAFFLSFNLIAQFKSGSLILQTLLSDVPLFESTKDVVAQTLGGLPLLDKAATDPGYVIGLVLFAVAVVIYTTYGGFRAVVWTDVMQGFIMVAGVLFMLPMAIWAVGGLGKATDQMAAMTPPRDVELNLTVDSPLTRPRDIPRNTWLVIEDDETQRQVFRTRERASIESGQTSATWLDTESNEQSNRIPAIQITTPDQIAQIESTSVADGLQIEIATDAEGNPIIKPYAFGDGKRGVYVTGPGPSRTSDAGFLPISLAISFFFMWTFSGAGQPGNMVRLMAFRNSKTLKNALFTMSIYYTLIYFPIVIIFCCARVLLPGWETESDRIMPEMARHLTWMIDAPWLAGLLVAAPFAAVMSTMDSFLLMISSAVVRDIYQRNINPDASVRTIKWMTYTVTFAIGLGAMIAALNPPRFLQDIIVFTGSGLSTSFLIPVGLSVYWPRFNKAGAFSGMLSGFGVLSLLYIIGFANHGELVAHKPGGFHPFLVGVAASLLISIGVTLLTPRPPESTVQRFFYTDAKPTGND